MRRRLYWMLPNLESARKMVDDLLLARIEERHLHFVASEDTDMSGLHPANILQTSDLVHAAEFGLVIGAATGAAAGALMAWYFPIVGEAPNWGLMGVLTIAGGLFGAWSASMIGASVPSQRIKRFQPLIDKGQILLMVDVPRSRVAEIEELLQKLHPESHLEGVEPNIPAFP
jgi:hypothetical protein